jgi:hypothetical protein
MLKETLEKLCLLMSHWFKMRDPATRLLRIVPSVAGDNFAQRLWLRHHPNFQSAVQNYKKKGRRSGKL